MAYEDGDTDEAREIRLVTLYGFLSGLSVAPTGNDDDAII